MGVKYYGPGEHKAGFIGFRATRAWDDNYQQEYFSTRRATVQDDSDNYFRYQHLRAQYIDTVWHVDSLWYQYQTFVTSNNPRTKPYRGVGVHGLTVAFARWNETYLEPCFQVALSFDSQTDTTRRGAKRFFLRNYRFSEAWSEAVNLWASEHDIMDEDRQRMLENPPATQQFKDLRRHMNDHEGHDISVETLGSVFQEKREQLQYQRVAEQAKIPQAQPKPSTDHQSSKEIEEEMLAWFKQASSA